MWKLISAVSVTLGMLAVTAADDSAPEPSVSVEFCGRLRHGVMAIGGETTGTTISFNRIIWEVQLQDEADRRFATQHHKATVVVTGSLRKVSGVERKDRWIIDVRKLSKQDVVKDKPGIKMTILGTLRIPDRLETIASWMTIVTTDKQVWPLDVSCDAILKATAESLVGQPVLLTGNLKPATDEKPDTPLTIQITTLKSPPPVPAEGSHSR